MRLLLINPCNRLSSMVKVKQNRWNKYRVWKPLGLLTLAGMTPPEWDITVIDENLGMPDYTGTPRPDLVGITAFTSQAPRAYDVAAKFRSRGVPVVMGGIHASMCPDEALDHVNTVVKGEGESVWPQVLEDAKMGRLERVYEGDHLDMEQVPFARHDLLPDGYRFGSIQFARGCPLNCTFCSVTAFNGQRYRRRPVDDVVREFEIVVRARERDHRADRLVALVEVLDHLFELAQREHVAQLVEHALRRPVEDSDRLEALPEGPLVAALPTRGPCGDRVGAGRRDVDPVPVVDDPGAEDERGDVALAARAQAHQEPDRAVGQLGLVGVHHHRGIEE